MSFTTRPPLMTTLMFFSSISTDGSSSGSPSTKIRSASAPGATNPRGGPSRGATFARRPPDRNAPRGSGTRAPGTAVRLPSTWCASTPAARCSAMDFD